MTLDTNLIFDSFKEEADIRDPNWFSGSIILENKPTLTFGLSGSYFLKNKDGSKSKAISFFQKASKHIEDYFKYVSSRGIANEIEIIIEGKKLIKIIPSWNQTIVETLESYLPKSKKGKCKPWYIDEDEWNKNSNNKIVPLKQIDIKVASIPTKEDTFDFELSSLSLRETALLVSSYCLESQNPLWDVGCLFFQKDDTKNLTVELIQYYFDDEDDKENNNNSFDQHKTLILTDRMKSIYKALQKGTKLINPSFEWDSVFITISRNGLEDLQFILNDEELDFKFE